MCESLLLEGLLAGRMLTRVNNMGVPGVASAQYGFTIVVRNVPQILVDNVVYVKDLIINI